MDTPSRPERTGRTDLQRPRLKQQFVRLSDDQSGDMAGNAPDPTTIGLPAVESGFTNSYLFAYTYMVGAITNQTNIYNYQINAGGQSANLLPDGTFITRRYKSE